MDFGSGLTPFALFAASAAMVNLQRSGISFEIPRVLFMRFHGFYLSGMLPAGYAGSTVGAGGREWPQRSGLLSR